MDVHVRDLRYFVAVGEELHFTRAAERLFVSQPALSKQIRVLEEQLRVELFVRDRRNVSLTPAGKALLRIGFSTSVGRGLLPRIQQHFARVRPNWRLQLRRRAVGAARRDRVGVIADARPSRIARVRV